MNIKDKDSPLVHLIYFLCKTLFSGSWPRKNIQILFSTRFSRTDFCCSVFHFSVSKMGEWEGKGCLLVRIKGGETSGGDTLMLFKWWIGMISYSATTMITWVNLRGKMGFGSCLLSLHSPLGKQGTSGIQLFPRKVITKLGKFNLY